MPRPAGLSPAKTDSKAVAPPQVFPAVHVANAAPAPAPAPKAPVARPNVVLIVADALRGDTFQGARQSRGANRLMPSLAAFADGAWNFANAHAQATWTKPSMVSIFTSLYPETHKVLFGIHDRLYDGQPTESDVLPDKLETMAAYLRRNGYATAGIQTNPNLQAFFGVAEGFESYNYRQYPECKATEVTDRAIKAVDKLKPPFFLYAHYMDTHAPYDPPEPYRSIAGSMATLTKSDTKILKHYNNYYIDHVLFSVGLTPKTTKAGLSAGGKEYIKAMYDGGANYLDAETARLIAHIDHVAPNTIVIVTADHGEELWDHGAIGHAKTVFEELSHVPLIVRVPGKPARKVDAPVETLDILPTCAGLVGLSPAPHWQGVDLSASIDALPMDRPIFTSTQMSIPGSNRNLAAIIVNNNKLIEDRSNNNRWRVFDLATDPREQHPVLVRDKNSAPWRKLLDDFAARNSANPMFQQAHTTAAITDEAIEQMKSMGYVGKESSQK